MADAGPVRISIVGDASDAVNAVEQVARAVNSTEERLDAAGRAAGAWADKVDFAGGAAAKLAGASGDIGGSLAAMGLISEESAAKFDQVGYAMMGVAGAADVATTAAALYSAAQNAGGVAAARNAVSQVASRTATIASSAATKAAAAAQWLFNAAMAANPIGLVVAAIALLVAGIIYAWKNSETFRKIVLGAWDAIKAAAVAVFGWLKSYLEFVFNAYKTVFTTAWNAISAYFEWAVGNYKAIWSGIVWLKDKAVEVWSAVKLAVGTAVDWVQGKIRDGVNRALAIWSAIVGLAGKVIELRDRLYENVRGVVDRFLGFGQDIMRGLANGIAAGMNWVRDKVRGLGNLIPGWLKDVLGISSPSRVMAGLGRDVIRGLSAGVDAQIPTLRRTMRDVSNAITDIQSPAISLFAGLDAGAAAVSGRSASATAQPVAITVNVAPGVDPAEVGRQVVTAIRALERREGRRLLAAA